MIRLPLRRYWERIRLEPWCFIDGLFVDKRVDAKPALLFCPAYRLIQTGKAG